MLVYVVVRNDSRPSFKEKQGLKKKTADDGTDHYSDNNKD